MRVTQPVVIVHTHGAVAIAVLDQQFNRATAFCRVSNRILETIGGICRAIEGHDLSANGETVFVSQSFPHHFGELGFTVHDHSERVTQICDLPAGLGVLEVIRGRLRVDEFISAPDKAIERSAGAVSIESCAQEFRPVVRLDTIERIHHILERKRAGRGCRR